MKKKVTALVSIVLTIALCGCSLFSPQAKLESLVASGQYEEAYTYWRDNKSDISKSDAATVFEAALDAMYEAYLAGELDAGDIEDFVGRLEGIDSDPLNSYGQRILANVAEIEVSREAFEDAETLFSSGDYPEALELYRQVVNDDPNYDTAQSQIDACINNYKTDMMQEAADYVGSDNYASAIDTLNALTAVIGSDSDVTETLNDYMSQYSDYIFQTAQELADSQHYDEALEFLEENSEYVADESQYDAIVADYEDSAAQLVLQSNDVAGLVADGNYDEAFSVLNTLVDLYPNSETLNQQISEAEDAYTASELEIIQGFIDAADYESAYDECNTALNRVPGRSELVTQRDYCEQRLPVPLDDCFSSSSGIHGYGDPSGSEGLFDNIFTDDDFLMYADNAGFEGFGNYADFYLDGQYDILRLGVTPFEHIYGDYVVFSIIADDEVIYEQSITNRTTPDLFDIDVSGVTWLRISFSSELSNRIVVVNPQLLCN